MRLVCVHWHGSSQLQHQEDRRSLACLRQIKSLRRYRVQIGEEELEAVSQRHDKSGDAEIDALFEPE